jgi:hypothetical protein
MFCWRRLSRSSFSSRRSRSNFSRRWIRKIEGGCNEPPSSRVVPASSVFPTSFLTYWPPIASVEVRSGDSDDVIANSRKQRRMGPIEERREASVAADSNHQRSRPRAHQSMTFATVRHRPGRSADIVRKPVSAVSRVTSEHPGLMGDQVERRALASGWRCGKSRSPAMMIGWRPQGPPASR